MREELQRIAERVKAWRLEAGLTLQEVSESAGVSASTVHKIENLQTVPTISVLLKLVNGLGRRAHELFEETVVEANSAAVLRVGSRESISASHGGAELQRVTGAIENACIDLWRVTHPPGHGTVSAPDATPLSYSGELVIMVDEGRRRVTVGEDEWELAPGDTLHFDRKTPHSWVNHTDEPVSAFFFALLPETARRLASRS